MKSAALCTVGQPATGVKVLVQQEGEEEEEEINLPSFFRLP